MYKRSLTHTARNAIGMGILNPKQILIGMNAALSHGPTQLLTMKERTNQLKKVVNPANGASDLQSWNYFLDSRTEPYFFRGAQP
jgi:hypothetical protein